MIELVIAEDRQDILNGNLNFLDSVLRGDGYIGYSLLSIEQNINEFIERETTHELFFDPEDEQFQQLLTTISTQTPTQFITKVEN